MHRLLTVPALSALLFFRILPAAPDDGSVLHAGEGTYYDADGGGNCMFDPSPDNLMVAAMNQIDYDNSSVCGSFIHITGPQGEVTVRIVDRCPECAAGDVDMSPQAFALIAPLEWGRVSITWRYAAGEVSGPIRYRFKDGSNPWWTAVQILNHRTPVAAVEMRDGEGNWVALERQEYNYFVEASGMGPGPYTIRVTDIYGRQLVDENIVFVEGGIVDGAANFDAPAAARQRAFASHPSIHQAPVFRILTDLFPADRYVWRIADSPLGFFYSIRGRRLRLSPRRGCSPTTVLKGVYIVRPDGE